MSFGTGDDAGGLVRLPSLKISDAAHVGKRPCTANLKRFCQPTFTSVRDEGWTSLDPPSRTQLRSIILSALFMIAFGLPAFAQSEHAALIDFDNGDKRSDATVMWRTEQVKASDGRDDLAICHNLAALNDNAWLAVYFNGAKRKPGVFRPAVSDQASGSARERPGSGHSMPYLRRGEKHLRPGPEVRFANQADRLGSNPREGAASDVRIRRVPAGAD